MEIQKSDVVCSRAGRDKGQLLFVQDVDGAYLLLVDGRGRKWEHPKRKKRMHVAFYASGTGPTAEKIRSGTPVSNRELRGALAAYAHAAAGEQGGM